MILLRSWTSELRLVAVGAASRYMALIASAVFSIGAARFLSPSGRGEMALVVQAGYLIGSLAVLGRERAIIAEIRQIGEYSGVKLGIFAVCGALPAVLALGGLQWLSLYSSVAGVTLAVAWGRLLQADLVRSRNTMGLGVLQFLMAAGFFVGFVAAQQFAGSTSEGWAAVFTVSILSPLLIFVRLPVGERPGASSGRAGVEAGTSRLALGDVGLAVSQRYDRLVLGVTGQTDALGRYTIAASITEIAAMPVTLAAQLRSRGGSDHSRSIEYWAWASLVFSLAFLIVWGDALVGIIVGDEYQIGRWLWVSLSVAAVSLSLHRSLSAVLIRQRQISLVSGSDIAAGVAALGLFSVLVPWLGSQGAAIGTSIAYLVGVVVLLGGRSRNGDRSVDSPTEPAA